MAYGHSVCALAARAGFEPALSGLCGPALWPLSYRAVFSFHTSKKTRQLEVAPQNFRSLI